MRRGSAPPTNLNRSYTRLRQIKSAEELDWLRIGAALTDRGMIALRDGLRPGLSERELADLVERSYVALGGTQCHSLYRRHADGGAAARRADRNSSPTAKCGAATSWSPRSPPRSGSIPARCCAASRSSAEPTPLYRELHAVADAAFDAVAAVLKDGALPREVIDAAGVIEQAGFTIIDDLLHGYGGGYLPPILGSRSRPSAHIPDEPFRAGMTVVIQPNVVTPDGMAGVQTGEMVLITATGIETIHAVPRGFVRV